MEKVGILVVSYGSRAAAMVDAFSAAKITQQKSTLPTSKRIPSTWKKQKDTLLFPTSTSKKSVSSAKKYEDHIDFGMVGPEKPIIDGLRDVVEKETRIPMICPTKDTPLKEARLRNDICSKKLLQKSTQNSRCSTQKITSTQGK